MYEVYPNIRSHQTLDKAIENLAKVKNTTPDKVMSSLQLVLVFFPAKGDEIRNTVKFWGDCVRGNSSSSRRILLLLANIYTGAATQCVREDKVKGANSQYWCNVLLKYVEWVIEPVHLIRDYSG